MPVQVHGTEQALRIRVMRPESSRAFDANDTSDAAEVLVLEPIDDDDDLFTDDEAEYEEDEDDLTCLFDTETPRRARLKRPVD